MSKRITPLILLLPGLLLLTREAKPLSFGIKAGFNLAYQTDPKVIPAEYAPRTDFTAGGFISFRLFGRVSLEPGVFLSREGVKSSDDYYSETVENRWIVSYLKVPVLLKYRLGGSDRISTSLLFGPYLSWRLSAVRVQDGFGNSEDVDIKHEVRPGDFGLILGGALETKAGPGRLIFDVRFNLGLANTLFKGGYNDWVDAPEDPSNSRNRVLSAMVGYAF